MELNKGYIVNGRYEILEKIGIGGMANVYCARDLKLERKVTFKVLKEEFIDSDFIKRFSTEAQAAAKLSHSNIANVHDVGNEDNIYYIVMEYVDGFTLKELIKNKVPFSDEEAIGIAIQISEALEVAHSNNIIHKDIKPQNILVTKDGIVKVTDFGIARTISSTTITTETVGTVHYFSPEQARGGYVDNRSDIYSLGIVIYEMITGRLPFDGETTVEIAIKHINSELPEIRLLNEEASDSIINIIKKCTSKNTTDRYFSVSELTKDLKKSLIDKTGNFIDNALYKNQNTITIRKEEIEEINRLNKNTNKKSKKDNNKKYKEPEKLATRKITLYALLTSFLVMISVSSLTYYLLSNLNKVSMPELVGKTWDEAVEIASEYEIYIQNTKEEYSEEYDEGYIIEQSISYKSKVKKGSTIDITLSLGSGVFTMPDFENLDISEVYEELGEYDINIEEEYEYSSKVDIGKVIKQSPSVGKEVNFGDTITLVISRGEESTTVIVPNLIGFTLESARASLNSYNLYVGSINYEQSKAYSEDTVISQSISAGSEVEMGRSINLVISSGYTDPKIEEEEITIKEETIEEVTEESENTSSSTSSKTEVKRETLIISPNIEETDEPIEVKIIQVNSEGETEIYINQHSYSDFPLSIRVSGNEPTKFKLYINGIYESEETKNFE